jgi:hypothetical protein
VKVGLAFISDRGDRYLPECRKSLARNCNFDFHARTVIDDREHELGMAGAVRTAWEWALEQRCDFLLHVEEDFVFHAPVRVEDLACILGLNPHLAQVVLKRQPWSPEEHQAGGIVELHPADYTECEVGDFWRWTEHRRIFSLNPCLIPRSVLELGWPDGNEAEFTQRCLDNDLRFAFLGWRYDPPRVCHVGAVRGEGWRL